MNNLRSILEKQILKLRVNPSRVHLERIVRTSAQTLPPNSLVLDAGAGDCPYRDHFRHCQYETADFCQVDNSHYGEITYVCDLESIPVEAERFNFVLSTQTLEHVPHPAFVLKELWRVLKPGGKALISAPLVFAEHQIPYDFYRYTRYGLCFLLEEAGFQVDKLEPLEGYYALVSYQLNSAASGLPLRPEEYGGRLTGFLAAVLAVLIKPFFFLLGLVFARLDLRYKKTTSQMFKNYIVQASKPDYSIN
jgi:SAM-dependent methyltransferase